MKAQERSGSQKPPEGLKPKDLIGIPWMLAFSLRADGWYLRSDIIWHAPNKMPSSQKDRPSVDYEHVFMLARDARYYYDAEVVKEPSVDAPGISRGGSLSRFGREEKLIAGEAHRGHKNYESNGTRTRRSVWSIGTQPFAEAHFATFPEKLVEPCVLAGSREGSLVLDPFAGSGTVGVVCERHKRTFIGIELNESYCEMAERRIERSVSL